MKCSDQLIRSPGSPENYCVPLPLGFPWCRIPCCIHFDLFGERRHVAVAQIEVERDECDQLGNYRSWPKAIEGAGASSIARLAGSRALQPAQLQHSMTEAVQLGDGLVRTGTDSMLALARGVSQR